MKCEHEPSELHAEWTEDVLDLFSHCRKCGFGLTFTVRPEDWEAYGDSTRGEEEEEK